MRIGYVTNVRLPNERAHGHQIANTVKSMVALGHEVEVFAPFRKNKIQEDFWTYYQMPGSVQLHYIGSKDFIASRRLPGVFGLMALNRMMKRGLYDAHLKHYDALFTRTPALLPAVINIGVPVILELHRIPRWQLSRFVSMCNHCAVVACLTTLMKEELIAAGVAEHRVIVEPDGVDIDLFSSLPPGEHARSLWGLKPDQFVVGYAGSLATMKLSKGIEDFLVAMKILHAEDPHFHALIAGGPDAKRRQLESETDADIATFAGQVPTAQVPHVFSAADVLVYLAPKSQDPFFMRDTSPLKLLEYMAARKPIVAAGIPPIKDIVDHRTALFYEPGNIDSLLAALKKAQSGEGATERIAAAFEKVQFHTWRKRTQRILSALKR